MSTGTIYRFFNAVVFLLALLTGLPAYASDPNLRCHDSPNPVAGRQPVLLLHGTSQDGASAWDWNYVPELNRQGIHACTVDLADRSLTDIQISAEYVVYAVRAMVARYASKIDIVGFSQGPLAARWAIKYWPDVRESVDDMVALAGPHHGSQFSNTMCLVPCIPAMQQMRVGSNFLAALNAGDETPGDISYTSIYSVTDDFVFPQLPQSVSEQYDGATNIKIQQLCPARVVDHLQMTWDAVAFALVLDAFTQPGPASISRFNPWTCLSVTMPGVTLAQAAAQEVLIYGTGGPMQIGPFYPKVSTEPPLREYATY